MCVFTDPGQLVDVGAGEGLEGFRVFSLSDEPGVFVSPMYSDAIWRGIPQRDGSWLIDGPTGARSNGHSHDPRREAEGFYIVEDRDDTQGRGVKLKVRPAGVCVRHELPRGWRASSLVVLGAVTHEAPSWLPGEIARLREEDAHGAAGRLAYAIERALPKFVAPPAWMRAEPEPLASGTIVDAIRSWVFDVDAFPASVHGYRGWHTRTVLVEDGETAERVNAFLGRAVDRDAWAPLSQYVQEEVASRLMVGSARLVLRSKFEQGAQKVQAIAGPMLERLGADIGAVIPPHEAREESWLLETCRAAEEKYGRDLSAARKQRREAERFGRQLVTMLRRDPRGAVDWLREQPAPVRKREGIVRSQDAGSVRFRLEGESWTLARFEPDVARLELVARGRSVDVSARWSGGRWHPAGTRHEDMSSSGWGRVHYGHRADTLARILGQRWRLVHLTYEEAGNRYGDTRAHLTERDARAIERARAASLKRVRAIVG